MILILLLLSTIDKKSCVHANESWISAQFTERLKTYDRRVRPFADKARLNVSLQLGVIGLGPIDSVSLTLRMDVYFRHWWKDERLDFGDHKFNFNGNPSELIWVPDTFGYNSVKTEQHKTLTTNTRTKLGPHGAVYLSTRLTLISFCKMNLATYPFDEQTCSVQFESYSYPGTEVNTSWKENELPIEYRPNHIQLSGYEVVNVSGRRSDIIYQNGEIYSAVMADIRLRRTFMYHLFSGYMPSIFLVVLTWATFWIPTDAVPARVTIIVTNFLSTIFVIQQELVKIIRVEYTTAMQILLITNLLFVSLAMVEYLVVLNTTRKRKDKEAKVIANGHTHVISLENMDEPRAKLEENQQRAENAPNTEKKHSTEEIHIVDYYCRIGMPIVYFIFLSIYLGYYKSQTS